MFQDIGELKKDIKEVVDPKFVKQEIQSSWSDFWNFQLVKDDSGNIVTLGIVIVALVCFVVGIFIAKWFSKKIVKLIFSRFEIAPSTLHIWNSMVFYVSCLFVTIIALKIAHVPLTIFTLMGGALALGIGFGSKNLVNNFMSGIIFMFEGPAKMGDFVEVDGYFGRVVTVGMRASQLELGLNRRATIPNSSFLEKTIVNWGRAGSPVYLNVVVSVDYGSDIARTEQLLMEIPKGVPQVLDTLPFRVLMKNFSESGIDLALSFPVQIYSPADRDNITSDIRKKIEAVFTREKIAIPYPQLVLHSTTSGKEKSPS